MKKRTFPKVVLTTLALSLAAAGCSNRNPTPTTPTSPANAPIEQRGDWFCQPSAATSQEPWECIQDAELASDPKPDRLPNASDNQPLMTPFAPPLTSDPSGPSPQVNGGDAPVTPQPPPPPPGLSQLQSSDPPGAAKSLRSTPSTTTSSKPVQSSVQSSAQTLPDYVRLAFQPQGPVSILDLPDNYYAVQLAALSTAQDIEAFVTKHQLRDLSAAKVAIDDKIRYVLILGIYDSRDKAELAVASQLPTPLDRFTPWIRGLGNLKQAMLAAQTNSKT